MRTIRRASACLVVLFALPIDTDAQVTIREFNFTTNNSTTLESGLKLPIPVGMNYHSITFNFYDDDAVPSAAGTMFILDAEYLGAPGSLSSSTPGFQAQSLSIQSGVYHFDPSFVLMGGTTYYFLTDTPVFAIGVAGFKEPDVESYTTSFGNYGPIDAIAFEFNHRLAGMPAGVVTSVPEASTFGMLALGMCVLGASCRRRARRRLT